MKKTNGMIKAAAILALGVGMMMVFVQGFYTYAADEATYEAFEQEYEESEAGYTVLADEALPAAQLPSSDMFPWWCWLVAIGVVLAGCAIYTYTKIEEKI